MAKAEFEQALQAVDGLMATDLFPPKGHRYWSDERLQELRDRAVKGDDVTLPAIDVLELICDLRNANAEAGI